MTKYTYTKRFAAHYAGRLITVPDQVAEAQRDHATHSFPALDAAGYPYNGRKLRVRLDGEAYGLWTSGTGDMICRSA